MWGKTVKQFYINVLSNEKIKKYILPFPKMATWRHEIFSLRTSGYQMLFKITLIIIVITYSIAEVRNDVALASVFRCLYLGFFTFWSEKSTSRAWHYTTSFPGLFPFCHWEVQSRTQSNACARARMALALGKLTTGTPKFRGSGFVGMHVKPITAQEKFNFPRANAILARAQALLWVRDCGKSGKGPGTGRSHDFQHPDIVGVNKL